MKTARNFLCACALIAAHPAIIRKLASKAATLTAIAMMLTLTKGQAQTQNPIPPPLSAPAAEYFQENPAAWNELLSQLSQRPAGTPQASPQSDSVTCPKCQGFPWTAVTTVPSSGLSNPLELSNPLLLTDGTVIVHLAQTQTWYKLTPDINGSYATGSWTPIASLPGGYGPRYFASAVLNDGRVIIQGGEYNLTDCSGGPVRTSKGAIYDPEVSISVRGVRLSFDRWTPVSPPSGSGWTNTATCGARKNGGIGDAASVVLPNGTFMLSACCALPARDALFNETTLTYSSTGAPIDPQPWRDGRPY